MTVVPQLQPSPENTVYILDGMAVIQMIKSGRTVTFGELAKHYFNTFTSPLSTHKCYCVHVVFDQYRDDSIKAGERARRGSSSAQSFCYLHPSEDFKPLRYVIEGTILLLFLSCEWNVRKRTVAPLLICWILGGASNMAMSMDHFWCYTHNQSTHPAGITSGS